MQALCKRTQGISLNEAKSTVYYILSVNNVMALWGKYVLCSNE